MKYNPKNEKHRKWLAQRVLKVLLGYGYVLDFDARGEELQFYRKNEEGQFGQVTVYTSIDRRSGAMRWKGTDAIRVTANTHIPAPHFGEGAVTSEQRFHRVIHRRGTLDTIAKRLAEALRIANWNIENPDKPKWDGQTAKKKRRRGGKIRKK